MRSRVGSRPRNVAKRCVDLNRCLSLSLFARADPQIDGFGSGSWSQKYLYRQAGFGVENGTWVLFADRNCDLVWFPDSYSGQTGSRTPRDRDFTEKYTFGVHLRLLIITNHCPFLGAKSRHVPSRLLYAILILCGLRIPFFCASRKSVKIT